MPRTHFARIALALASCIAALLLGEGVLTAFRFARHGGVDRRSLIEIRQNQRDDVVGGHGRPFENRLVLHPLFGYTFNPADEEIDNLGFWTPYDIVLDSSGYVVRDHARDDHVVVGIFGGSFAGLAGRDGAYLENALRPLFPDRRPIVLNFAVGGHALPQSAFVYLYFRELCDVVVFVDGLNELWNYVENNRSGYPPEYAKAFHYTYKLSRQELTPAQFERTAEIVALRRRIEQATSLSLWPVLRRSVLVHELWSAAQLRWSGRIAGLSREIEETYQRKARFFDRQDDDLLRYAARQWRSYHDLVDTVARSNGALSIHLLQPNPFVPGSKVLTEAERKRVLNSYAVQDYVLKGYPLLQEEIFGLRAQGAAAEDLTGVYRDVHTSIWNDSAHPNAEGVRLVLDHVAAIIERSVSTGAWQPTTSTAPSR
jgi:hypothetical protein